MLITSVTPENGLDQIPNKRLKACCWRHQSLRLQSSKEHKQLIKNKVKFKPSHLFCAWRDLSVLLQLSMCLKPSFGKAWDIPLQKPCATCAEVCTSAQVKPLVLFLAHTSHNLTSHLSFGCIFTCCAPV